MSLFMSPTSIGYLGIIGSVNFISSFKKDRRFVEADIHPPFRTVFGSSNYDQSCRRQERKGNTAAKARGHNSEVH
jgi:hypothetical protein